VKDTEQQEDQENTSVMTMVKRDVVFVVYFFIGMARTVLVVIWHCVVRKEPRLRESHIMIQMEKMNSLLSRFNKFFNEHK
jgi:hypothetical protein